MYYQVEIGKLVTTPQGSLLMSIKKLNQYHTKKIYLQQTHGIPRNMNIKYAELVKRIYNAFLLVSVKYRNKGRTNQEETVHGYLICILTIKNKYLNI